VGSGRTEIGAVIGTAIVGVVIGGRLSRMPAHLAAVSSTARPRMCRLPEDSASCNCIHVLPGTITRPSQ
jgi:hypothetical protein